MASQEILGKLEDMVQCPVCLEQFTEPRVLPCQHTFCTECLLGLLGSGRKIRCPCCNKETPVPNGVQQLPVDFRANTLLETLSQAADVREAKVPAREGGAETTLGGFGLTSLDDRCPVCDEIPTVPKNLSCGHRLCELCVQFLQLVGGGTLHCPTCSCAARILRSCLRNPATSSIVRQPVLAPSMTLRVDGRPGLQIGQKVRVKPGVLAPENNWGSVTQHSVGTIKGVDLIEETVRVAFPESPLWMGLMSEMEPVSSTHPDTRLRQGEHQQDRSDLTSNHDSSSSHDAYMFQPSEVVTTRHQSRTHSPNPHRRAYYDSRGGRGSRERRGSRGGRGGQGSRETRGSRGSRGGRGSREGRGSRGGRGSRESRGSRGIRGGRGSREGQGSRRGQGSREDRGSQGGQGSRGSQRGQSYGGFFTL